MSQITWWGWVHNSYTVFPWILARGNYFFFCTKRGQLFNGGDHKQLLDKVFVMSTIIKVLVRVIILSLWLQLITHTSTLIILGITKTESNNWISNDVLLYIEQILSFPLRHKMFFKACTNSFFSSGSLSFFLFHVISKQLLCHLHRPFSVLWVLMSSTIFSMSCLVNEANLEVMFLLLHRQQATQSAQTWYDYP